MSGGRYKAQALNTFLRLLPMGAKMLLTLYMGRYFALAEIGVYGLVLGAVAMLGVVLGFGLHYVVARAIVGEEPAKVLHKMRDEALFYGANFAALAVLMAAVGAFHLVDMSPRILFYIFALSILESINFVTYTNMNALNQQIPANVFFFVRGGLWVAPVILQCMLNPAARTADTVLIDWILFSLMALALTLWHWRTLPWSEVMRLPVDWQWLKKGVGTSCLIWLGLMGLAWGTYIDRFVVEHLLTLSYVGILTFYFSFTNAMLTLMQSGVLAFATPRLVQHHRDGDVNSFVREARHARRQVLLGAALAVLALGFAVPFIAHLLGRDAIVAESATFWLMLIGTMIRADAEFVNDVLFARHQDFAVWCGNLLFLALAFAGSYFLVQAFGFKGIGYSAILSAAFLLTWRLWHIRDLMGRPSNVH